MSDRQKSYIAGLDKTAADLYRMADALRPELRYFDVDRFRKDLGGHAAFLETIAHQIGRDIEQPPAPRAGATGEDDR